MYWITKIENVLLKIVLFKKIGEIVKEVDILNQVQTIFIDVLDNPDLVLTETTTAADVDDWDSLTHIHLVVAVEKFFKVRFTSKEIQSWDNVGEMINCIAAKLS